MQQQNILWKQIVGGIFIALGLGIYAAYFLLLVVLHRLAGAELDPSVSNMTTVMGVVIIGLTNWPSVLLLGFGIPWLWNSRPAVRVWCYRALAVFFLGVAGFFAFILFVHSHAAGPSHATAPTHAAVATPAAVPTHTAGPAHAGGPNHAAGPNHATAPNHTAVPSRTATAVPAQKAEGSAREQWAVEAGALCYAVVGLVFCWRSFVLSARLKNSGSKESAAQPAIEAKPQFAPAEPAATTPPLTPAVTSIRPKRWAGCNILHLAGGANRLWQFDARGGRFTLGRAHSGQTLPNWLVAKSWSSLWQPKLNVAWLPPEDVFLRVIELPKSEFDETLSMVELQLEKASPLPVAQIAWTMHILPGSPLAARAPARPAGEPPVPELQTVIVVIVARGAVEEFLGKLEGQGFLADRLEVPMLDQLEAAAAAAPHRPDEEPSAWIYPVLLGGQKSALVAWWAGGILRNLSFVALPTADGRGQSLKDQLAQLTWSGELEGWLTTSPRWHLVADPVNAAEWEKLLRDGLGETVEVSAPLAPADLAGRTARRAATTSPRSNLLPAEFSDRYRQQFFDRLWFRGLLATGVLYAVGVAIYFAAVSVLSYRTQGVEQQVAALKPSFTQCQELQSRYAVLQERENLKYAALDCWRVIAEQLPEGISLQRFSFAKGGKLTISGTCTSDQITLVTEKDGFYDSVRKAQKDGQPMFSQDPARGDQLVYRLVGPNEASWNFSLELQHSEGGSQ